MCVDAEEGGLGLRSLICVNQATNLKLCWELNHSEEQWESILRSRAIRVNNCIHYHTSSSIWSGVKSEFSIFKENTCWIIGNGKRINFSLDNWGEEPLIQSLQIFPSQIHHYPKMLSDYVSNYKWTFPADLIQEYPILRNLAAQVTLPTQSNIDKLVWKHVGNGILTLKEAYNFKKHCFPKVSWAKFIWSKDIPPSKSLLAWRLMLNKLPTDDNLQSRGCLLPSICSLCYKNAETCNHLFLECSYATHLWNWLASTINRSCNFQTIEEIRSICNGS